jgi:multidrug resistance efflux pump
MFRRRPVAGGMIAGGATAAVVGHHAAKKQFESMQKAQAQQAQLNQAQAQAQAAQAQAQAAQMQAAQATSQSQGPKKDVVQELEKLANLKQQGILSEEEFQQMKARLLSSS